MKQIENNNQQAQWENNLLHELEYIKKHLRYKPKRKTYVPVVFWGSVLLLVGIACIVLLVTSPDHKRNYIFLLVGISTFIIHPLIIIRYLSSLTFTSISTDFFSQQNQYLIERFLKSENMMIYRHPEAPEVFQIQSRNLYSDRDYREIIIFIADDMRILINSHFTNGGWTLANARRHHRQMGDKLKKWIAENAPASGSLTRQKF